MTSDAIYYHEPFSKLLKLSSLHLVSRMHDCITTVINFETTKFCHNLHMNKYLNVSTWILFSIKQRMGVAIILWLAAFVKCKQFGMHCLWIFTWQFSHQFIHRKCIDSHLCSQQRMGKNQKLTHFKYIFVLYCTSTDKYHFFYRQNNLKTIRTVNVPNVATCFMIPSFQMLTKIVTMFWPTVHTTECLTFVSAWMHF